MIDECPHAEAHEPHIFGRLLTDGDELVLGAPLSCGGMTGTEAALARDPELMARIDRRTENNVDGRSGKRSRSDRR